jgi:hypothetical protein
MPLVFEKLGISFQYPDNWSLDEVDAMAGRKSVTVYSPGGGFWSVSIHPPAADPGKLARGAVDAMRAEYPEIEVESARDTIAGRATTGFDLSFYYLDLTSTASVRCLRTDRATYVVFSQAEDREFKQLELVFRAMTTSLLSSIGKD